MPELNITVVMPKVARDEEAAALDALMSALAAEAGRQAILQRQPGFGQKEGPPRVFAARFSGEEPLAALMRAAGGWFMRHPHATVTFKMESSKGGTTLQLKSYSPVGLAQTVAQLQEYLE